MNTVKYMAVVLVVVTMFVPTLLVVMMVVRVRVDLPQPKVRYSSLAQTGIMDDLGLAVAEYSLFGSTLTIGAMIGAIVSGKIADFIGRRGTMDFSDIFCLAGWLAIAFSKGTWWLDLGRLLVGIGMGLISYVLMICCGGIINISNWSFCELANFGSNWNYPMSCTTSWSILHSRVSKMARVHKNPSTAF